MLVYHPNVSNKNIDICNKIYSKICGDFYIDRPGDRSVMLLSTSASSIAVTSSNSSSLSLFSGSSSLTRNLVVGNESVSSSFAELLSKLREGIKNITIVINMMITTLHIITNIHFHRHYSIFPN